MLFINALHNGALMQTDLPYSCNSNVFALKLIVIRLYLIDLLKADLQASYHKLFGPTNKAWVVRINNINNNMFGYLWKFHYFIEGINLI